MNAHIRMMLLRDAAGHFAGFANYETPATAPHDVKVYRALARELFELSLWKLPKESPQWADHYENAMLHLSALRAAKKRDKLLTFYIKSAERALKRSYANRDKDD